MNMNELAKIGAKARLDAIEQEKAALHEAFPGIEEEARLARLRANMEKARAAKAARANGQ
jgi:hypothetical protein